MEGFLCIDKPRGITSRDVVNQIQRWVRPTKVGHAGTLDPLATGVLVVALGRATRLVQYVQRMRKCYSASFLLGRTSDTEDITGSVLHRRVERIPTDDEMEQVCGSFVGEIQQRPPAFSALKVRGQRAHARARRGQHVELDSRRVMVHEVRLRRYEYPAVEISVACGGGTYIRSLGRDIGEELGCGAVMSALRRTAIGSFTIERGRELTSFTGRESVARELLPLTAAVEQLPCKTLTPEERTAIRFGRQIALDSSYPREVAAMAEGVLLAILVRTSAGSFRPAPNFSE